MISDRDHGDKAFRAKLKGLEIKVGVPDTPRDDGTPMDEIGAIHEFGDGKIPARSFLRAWVDEHAAEADAWIRDAATKYVRGKDETDPGKYLGVAARKIIDSMRKRMEERIPPPLAQATLKRRQGRGTVPLVDSRQLINSLTYEIAVKGETHHPDHDDEPETEENALEGDAVGEVGV